MSTEPSLCAILIIGIIGCGEGVNNQPVIEEISDVTLNVDTESAVEVNVTDTDPRDTHSVRASSNDTAIATVSVNDTTLTISTIVEGVTTITVSAEDDSGVSNAMATPVTFQVTVKANSQPVLEAIPDVTIRAGIRFEVNLNITDADVDDTHSIWPSSSDRKIVEMSRGFKSKILPIVGDSEGITTISVYVKDDSGVSNAESTPVTFQVTVEPYVDKGLCVVGMTLSPGESCTYFVDATEVVFFVNDELGCIQARLADGTLGGVSLCAYPDIDRARFTADKNHDKSWTIERLP